MSLSKNTTSPKGVPLSYFKIANISGEYLGEEKKVIVELACYVSQDFKEADEMNNIVDKYRVYMPYIDEDLTRATTYTRIKQYCEEFIDAIDV